MSKVLMCGIFVVSVMSVSAFAELAIKPSVGVQVSKSSEPATQNSIDDGFIRSEIKFAASTESGVSGLLHLRLQNDLTSDDVTTKIPQAYFTIPVPYISSLIGRWYESYTPGNYFGRYLFGVNPDGSGSFKTNYTVIDGLGLSVPLIKQVKTTLHAALLPQSFTFDDTYAMFRISSQPLKQLSMNAATNINVVSENDDHIHRLVFTARYEIITDLALFTEYGAVDLADMEESSWILTGISVPTAGILDLLQAEIEIKKDRSQTYDSGIAWIILLGKKYKGVSFDLAAGADPRRLGSETASDVGAFMRISTKF